MTNPYFDDTKWTPLARNTLVRAEAIDAIIEAIVVGFDGVPPAAQLKTDSLGFCVDTGTANAYVIAPTYPIVAYAAGQRFSFVAVHANTGASTVNVSAIGVATIKRPDGNDLAAGDIPAGRVVSIEHDGTNFQLMSAAGSDVTATAASAAAAAASATAAASSASAASGSASSASTSATAAAASAATALGAIRVPTRQILTSGSSATYTTPAGVRQLRIRFSGGSGGSGGANGTDGGAGGDTTFNSIVAKGGAKGTAGAAAGAPGGGGAGGTGGSGSASYRVAGQAGTSGINVVNGSSSFSGAPGGTNPLGITGGATLTVAGFTGGTGGSGGGPEYVEIIINNPAATYTYTVGSAGAAGTGSVAGAVGMPGVIIVDEI